MKKACRKTNIYGTKNINQHQREIYFTLSEISIANKIINNAIKFWNKLNKNKFKAIIFLELSSTKLDDIQFGVKHENKSWGFNNWLKLIDNTKDEYLYIQSKHANSKNIEGVYLTENINFREACAVLNKSDLYVGPEGGFGHAAAALRKKAVLYFGGWIDPEVIGYNFHKNIYFDHKMSPCGEYKKNL